MTLYHHMRLAVWLFFATVGLSLLPVAAQADVRVGRDRALRSLVQVTVKTRFGTMRRGCGYLFGSSGNMVVPFHLVSDAKSVQVFQTDIGVFTAHRVKRAEPRSDLAVLALDTSQPIGDSFVHLADSRNVKLGDVAHVMSHALGAEKVEYDCVLGTAGYARQLQDNFVTDMFAPEQAMFEVTGPFDSGSAGGLVLNANYDMIGMIIGGGSYGSPRTVSCLSSAAIAPTMAGTYTGGFEMLQTENASDAQYFDKFLGPSPQPADFNSAMGESYVAWFTPMQPVGYKDAEFTAEINDKISKNWFCTTDLVIDGRPVREWSAGRFCVMPANVNPWKLTDSAGQLMHFDADSRFSRIIHKDRETEERIMTRALAAVALPPGTHKLQYTNKGANYKATGIRRASLTLEPGRVHLIDITGLSLVSMKLLPKNEPGAGEKQSVRYELERKPLGEREVNLLVRLNRFPVRVQ